MARKAEASWVPSSLPRAGCFRSTPGRILPTFSTGLDVSCLDVPKGGAGDQFRRKRTDVDRRDNDLAAAADVSQQRCPAFQVQLRQNVVQQEHRRLAGAPGDQLCLGQLQTDHCRALLALICIAAIVLYIMKQPQDVPVLSYS